MVEVKVNLPIFAVRIRNLVPSSTMVYAMFLEGTRRMYGCLPSSIRHSVRADEKHWEIVNILFEGVDL